MYLWKGREEIKQTLFVIVNFCLTKLRYINILKEGGKGGSGSRFTKNKMAISRFTGNKMAISR